MRDYNVISADSHLECPPDLWARRLPDDLRAEAPRVVDLPDGGQGWVMGNSEPIPFGLVATGGRRYDEFAPRGLSYTAGLPGTGSPEQRLAEQDQDGVDAEVLFSSVVATALPRMTDQRLIVETARAYNDWLSEYCSHAPDRLFGMALMPHCGVDQAVAELERVAAKPGIRAVQLLRFPAGKNWATIDDEKFWAAASQLGMTITGHHNIGGEGGAKAHPMPGLQSERAVEMEGSGDLASFAWLLTCDLPIPTLPILTIEQLFLGGVLDRHPQLRFHLAETGIGWLGYWLEQVDDRYDRHRFWSKVNLPRRPSDYVRTHFTFSFQEDHAGVALRHAIGLDNICWASDFPHSVSDWPWSRETRARQFHGLPEAERRRIEALNIAAQLGVVSQREKDELSRQPRSIQDPEGVPGRGERRLPALAAS